MKPQIDRATSKSKFLIPLLLIFCAFITGCSEPAYPGAESSGGGAEEAWLEHKIELGSIESVLVVRGIIVSRPQIALVAPEKGIIGIESATHHSNDSAQEESFEFELDNLPIRFPHEIEIDSIYVEDGQEVLQNMWLASGRFNGFSLKFNVPSGFIIDLQKSDLKGRALITDGPGGIECEIMPGYFDLSEQIGDGEAESVPAHCLIPRDLTVAVGMAGQIGMVEGEVHNAVILPLSMVTGNDQSGVVNLVTSQGEVEERVVKLGLSDGNNIEVISGLSLGDVILTTPPRL